MNEVVFDKYAVKGAYHWTEYFGPVHRINAYTRARYHCILSALRHNNVVGGKCVLDVGCGDGALAGLCAMRLGVRVSGVDTTPLSIDLAKREFRRRGLKGDFRLIDGYRYPYPDRTFYAVVCCDVIEHVREPVSMLSEMWRVLAGGGVMIVTTPVRYTELPLDRLHVREWFPREFRDFCSTALGVEVSVDLSHPIAWAELYASPTPVLGRLSRLYVNVLSKIGVELFLRKRGFRAFSLQIAIARKE